MKPITIVDSATPDTKPIPVETLSSNVDESSQRGRRVVRHPLEEEVELIPEKAEAGPATIENKEQDHQELVNEHYDHHDDDNYAYDKNHDHSPQPLDTIGASPLSQTIPVQQRLHGIGIMKMIRGTELLLLMRRV